MLRWCSLLALIVSLPASAVLIYEPGQVQFGQKSKYYYGGSDPSVHAYANRWVDPRTVRDAEGQLSKLPKRVYTDQLPRLNAALFGTRAADAINEFRQSVPTYFRKRDLLNSAYRDKSGAIIVPAIPSNPATSGSIIIRNWSAPVREAKPILIIPKDQLRLDAPLTPADDGKKSA